MLIDTETSGLDPYNDELIELAAVRIKNNEPVADFQSLCRPKKEINGFIQDLTGITNKELKKAPPLKKVLKQFVDFVGDSIIMGHNVERFDINFLIYNCHRELKRQFKNDYVDTLKLARRYLYDIENHKLATVAEYFNAPNTAGAHRAHADCLLTYYIYKELKQFIKRPPVRALKKTRPVIEKAFVRLKGILEGIFIDGVVTKQEFKEIKKWYEEYKANYTNPLFTPLLKAVYEAMADGEITPEECDNILWVCKNIVTENKYSVAVKYEIQNLHGIIEGILADGIITDGEVRGLNTWLAEHENLKGTHPFDDISSMLEDVLADGVIDDYERKQLKALFEDCINTRITGGLDSREVQELTNINNICSKDSSVVIKNKLFCFTGDSIKELKRAEIAEIITQKGGVYKDTVVKDTTYLIVGGVASPLWAYAPYGRKIEKALEWRKKGIQIQIIKEADFWAAIK